LFREFNDKLDNLELEEYILICKNEIKNTIRKQLRIAYAHYVIGNNEEVLNYLSMIEIEKFAKNRRGGVLDKMSYFSYYARYYTRIGDVLSAEQALLELENLLHNPKLTKRDRVAWKHYHQSAILLLNMKKGVYEEGCESYFTAEYERANTLLGKVAYKGVLGEIYLNENRIDEAAEAFKYISKYGGTTWYKKEANKQLDALEREIPKPVIIEEKKDVKLFTFKELLIFGTTGLVILVVVGSR